MKPYKVAVTIGTNTSYHVVRARHHEEAERMALLAAGARYEDVDLMVTKERVKIAKEKKNG